MYIRFFSFVVVIVLCKPIKLLLLRMVEMDELAMFAPNPFNANIEFLNSSLKPALFVFNLSQTL